MSNPKKPDKSPREMAIDHANMQCPEQGPEYIVWCMCRDDYLAGLKAGAKMGWEARVATTELEDGCKLRRWTYFDEWWDSLEGKK